MIWRVSSNASFAGLDRQQPSLKGNIMTKFWYQHYGKSISIAQWEDTCDYYAHYFPEPYKTKWRNRKGKAIHEKPDFNSPLYLWKHVKKKASPLNP